MNEKMTNPKKGPTTVPAYSAAKLHRRIFNSKHNNKIRESQTQFSKLRSQNSTKILLMTLVTKSSLLVQTLEACFTLR